ncbi:hypothetical protein FRC17_006757 [Serendipita sp. 399]|nr:hypothetical protein FRC17_006757 [Serendipita sp. 399]
MPEASLTAPAEMCSLQALARILLQSAPKYTTLIYREPESNHSLPSTPDGSFVIDSSQAEELFQSLKATCYPLPRTVSPQRQSVDVLHLKESEIAIVDSLIDTSTLPIPDSHNFSECLRGGGTHIHVKWDTMANTLIENVVQTIIPGVQPVTDVRMYVHGQVSSLVDALNQWFTVREFEQEDGEWVLV